MTNSDIAEAFETIVSLLQMKNEKGFTVRAYQRAARTIDRLPRDVDAMIRDGEDLTDIPGIGQGHLRQDHRVGHNRGDDLPRTPQGRVPRGSSRSRPDTGPRPQDRSAGVERAGRHLSRSALSGHRRRQSRVPPQDGRKERAEHTQVDPVRALQERPHPGSPRHGDRQAGDVIPRIHLPRNLEPRRLRQPEKVRGDRWRPRPRLRHRRPAGRARRPCDDGRRR